MAKKSDLIPRFITAIIAVPLLVVLISMAPHWGFFLLILAAGAISIWEFCGIVFAKEHPAGRIFSVVVGLALMSAFYFDPFVGVELFAPGLAATTVGTFLFYLFFYKDQSRVTHHIGGTLTAILYGGVLFTFIALIGRDGGDSGWMWILMTLAIVWGSDTGAYFAGNALGKHKLYEAVSPNKSIEGAVGGVVASIAFAFGFDAIFTNFFADTWTGLSPLHILALAIPANILGQTGDLAESLFKRAHEVKDSGTIIYGHGGILDRIDAVFFASPWVYYFMLYTIS